MKSILLLLVLASCGYQQELQVSSTYVTILEVTTKQRYGYDDMAVFHLQTPNGIHLSLERPMSDTAYFVVGQQYPYLSLK